MSGTSLDGLDISYVDYNYENDAWHFSIITCETIEYPAELKSRLQQSIHLNGIELAILDGDLGRYFAAKVLEFLTQNNIPKSEVLAIASHGHTIFHQPNKRTTVQIGCGDALAYETGITVINDFRKKDVVAGGQGAPLVPIGDFLLFNQSADSFLNIGGFANISFKKEEKITAFDICPANIGINLFSQKLGFEYDKSGEIASKAVINIELLDQLNQLTIYSEQQPQSLGTEWLNEHFLPIIDQFNVSNEVAIATLTEHLAIQISKRLTQNLIPSVFITGGGAKNTHLIKRIRFHFKGEIAIPEEIIIDFKEAIVFGFLAVLYIERIPNCLSSVTGAPKDLIGGVMHLPC